MTETPKQLAEKVRLGESGGGLGPRASAALDALLARLAEAEEELRHTRVVLVAKQDALEDAWAAEADRDRYRDVVDAAKALYAFGYDDPPNSVIFDPYGASEQIATLAAALAALDPEQKP